MFIKVILFYFAFSVIRSLVKGFTQVKHQQNAFKDQFRNEADSSKHESKSKEDVVEAEFRRL